MITPGNGASNNVEKPESPGGFVNPRHYKNKANKQLRTKNQAAIDQAEEQFTVHYAHQTYPTEEYRKFDEFLFLFTCAAVPNYCLYMIQQKLISDLS